MALREELERHGNWLFRWRSYLPIIMTGIYLLALREYSYSGHRGDIDPSWKAFCLIVCFIGLGIRAFTVGHTPKRTSGRNTSKQVAETLNTTGIYSVVRNPLYLGNFIIGLGFAMFLYLWWFTLIYILAFWLYYERIIYAEEEYLRNKFGDEYLAWANVTPAFIPKLGDYSRPSLPFSLKNVLRREYNGFFVIIVVLFVLEFIGGMFFMNKLEIDFMWYVLLIVGFIIWITLRMLKKYTVLLNVKGR